MVTIDKIFDLKSGNDLELCYLTVDENGIDFVSRTSKNNGVSAKVAKIYGIDPIPGGTISVSMGGSVMEAFFHENEYYTGYHMKILVPKIKLSIEQIIYYCMCIRANKFKYSFGRQANNTISSLLVPDVTEIPNWITKKKDIQINDIPNYFLEEGYEKACWYLDNVNQDEFEKKYSKKCFDKQIQSQDIVKKKFDINKLFLISRGLRHKSIDRMQGDIPYYSASKENNGLTDYISNPLFTEKNAIIFTTFGDCYYVDKEFTASDEITILKNDNLNIFNSMYVCTILSQEQFRFSFGRKAFESRIKKLSIELPSIVNSTGEFEPDWIYMENYIKSLPYSSGL